MRVSPARVELPGIAFEKAVASIQAQFDPAAAVTHNEILTDRLGHPRQFDVVVRGVFAGQKMLGVIECKDLGRKVGSPEIDSFVTKAQEVNANFKIVMSRRGFTKPALAKCAHYGIQALSLLSDDPANKKFFIGTRWEADITRWGQISITLHFAQEPIESVHFNAQDLTIQGKKVLDWFTNYLLDKQDEITELGWVVNISKVFNNPQSVAVREGAEYICTAISFMAERVCDRLERLVGISGTGFLDWHSRQATFPPGTQIKSDPVPMDFTQWQPRTERAKEPSGFIDIRLTGRSVQFERVPDAIELDLL
jgi:restriction endonuclease